MGSWIGPPSFALGRFCYLFVTPNAHNHSVLPSLGRCYAFGGIVGHEVTSASGCASFCATTANQSVDPYTFSRDAAGPVSIAPPDGFLTDG